MNKVVTGALDHARRQSNNKEIASFAVAVKLGARHQPEDDGEVAEVCDGRGHEDRADGTKLDGFN
ncbi:MAG: hypothetical protein ACEPO2_07085 [Pelagibaca sp.]